MLPEMESRHVFEHGSIEFLGPLHDRSRVEGEGGQSSRGADESDKESVFVHYNGATPAETFDDLDAVSEDRWQVEELVGPPGGEKRGLRKAECYVSGSRAPAAAGEIFFDCFLVVYGICYRGGISTYLTFLILTLRNDGVVEIPIEGVERVG